MFILRGLSLIKVREGTPARSLADLLRKPFVYYCYLAGGKRCGLGKVRNFSRVLYLVGCYFNNAANTLPLHLDPNSLAYSLPSHYLNQSNKVILFQNAHLTPLFSTHPSIVHSLRRGVKQMRGLVSLFPWRLVLAVDSEMGCTQFHRRGRSRQDKSACVRMPRPQL